MPGLAERVAGLEERADRADAERRIAAVAQALMIAIAPLILVRATAHF